MNVWATHTQWHTICIWADLFYSSNWDEKQFLYPSRNYFVFEKFTKLRLWKSALNWGYECLSNTHTQWHTICIWADLFYSSNWDEKQFLYPSCNSFVHRGRVSNCSTCFTLLKFSFSEKPTKIWKKSSTCFEAAE